MNEFRKPDHEDIKSYLLDMLSQLAKMANTCDEPGIALVLQTIVATRGQVEKQNGMTETSRA